MWKGIRWVGNDTRRGPKPEWVCKDVSSQESNDCKNGKTKTASDERELNNLFKTCTYQ